MSTELATYTVADVSEMAKAVADSRMFGMDRAQAMTLMLLAQAKGIHPIAAVERYHVIQGRPAMKADAMLADFMDRGGTVEWVERTDTAWEGVFKHPTQAPRGINVRFTFKDAERAQLLSNAMWKKYPGNMLRARVISNAIRTVMPGIVAGIYTPEEVADMPPMQAEARVADPPAVESKPPPAKRDNRPLYQLVADGVGAINAEFRAEFPDPLTHPDPANGYQVERHTLKFAVAAGWVEDPGKIKQGECSKILGGLYGGEHRRALRAEVVRYLGQLLADARERARVEAEGDAQGDDDLPPWAGGDRAAESLPDEPGMRG